MWLKSDDELIFIDGDSVSSLKSVPNKVYKTVFTKMQGTFLKETEVKLEHGKIYGNSQDIADHIIQAYELNEKSKNLGVLLSGGRGLGKTLTTRLVIEKFKGKYPIVLISEYTPDLPDFLSHLKNCVILMDEFEKFMGGSVSGSDDEEEQTKQESILSVLDGNTGCASNLFLLTANDIHRIDENLKSRPGRIRYHYKYESESAEVVRNYCKDNLKRKDIIEDVVQTLGCARYVSLDIITSFVDELNNFPNLTPLKVMEFFNIETSDTKYKISIAADINGKRVVYERVFRNYLDEEWCTLTPKLKSKYSDDNSVPEHINISLDEDCIPSLIFGKAEIDISEIKFNDISGCDESVTIEDIKFLSAIIEDTDFNAFSKRYNRN